MVFLMMICVTSFFHATTASLCSVPQIHSNRKRCNECHEFCIIMVGGPTFFEWLQGWKTLRRMQDVDKDAGAPIEKAEEGAPIGARPKEPAAPYSSLAPPTGSVPRRMELTSSGPGEEEKLEPDELPFHRRKSPVETLPFQAEGHRHCAVLILNFGEENSNRTHGGGWKSDIMVALQATCCSIHAWFDMRYDTDPRVSLNSPRNRVMKVVIC